ncbi:MAG: hypothetical protein ABFC88_02435 [Thermoguttaceae bacterium]
MTSSKPETGKMYETTITYDNSDRQCCFDDDKIRATMNWWHGREIDSGLDLDAHIRKITFAFDNQDDAIKASRALEGLLGSYFEPVERRTITDEPKKPKSTDAVIDHAPDTHPTPQESASALTFDQRAGLKYNTAGRATELCTAQEVFNDYRRRLGWDFAVQSDVLVNFCGDNMIEPLLRYIDDSGQTEDFAGFLADNFENDDARRVNRLPCHPEHEGQSQPAKQTTN